MSQLKLALRSVTKTPFVTAVAVLSLALGIGANAAIFSLFDQILLRPLPVEAPGQLVNLAAPGPNPGMTSCSQAGGCEEIFSYEMFRDLERAQSGFSGIAAHRDFDANLAHSSQTSSGQGMLVSGSYFPVLGLRAALGRLLDPGDDETVGENFVTVLSHDYWVNRLGSDPGVLGEFKRSSQHLRKEEELRWRQASADGRIELCVRRWVHPVVPRWGAGSIGRGFGKKLLEGCRARSRRWQPACLPLLARAGFANVVACHLSVFVLCRGATYRSSSEKRLRFFKPAVVAYVRSPGSCAAHRRRSRENCGGTQQREVETSSIEPRPPNGMPIGERSVRKLPNSLRTAN